ncbi:recombinase family protein [Cellulomonas sp. HZM]|uniref:recombinase family protein n=1 Tax=Cellulomonas sp. HZM TaxID=1454010 RepID=UPI0005554F94|nr:recombinase family protein [Cellulomonas sp. HZM]
MALVGYQRVSTAGQRTDRQDAALLEAGCERVYTDVASGRSLDGRPELAAALDYLREGDTLVVLEASRLCRSLKDFVLTIDDLRARGVGVRSLAEGFDTTPGKPESVLLVAVFGALAQIARETIVRNTREGLEAARARGTRLGRPPALTDERRDVARDLLGAGRSIAATARGSGVSRATIQRGIAAGVLPAPSYATASR